MGRQLCFYYKREHTFLAEQVLEGKIRYDTSIEIDIEHCTAERPAMSLRASYQDQHSADSAYNRYMKNFDMMVSEVEDGLAVDRNTGDKMWNVKVTANDKKRVLGPKNVPEHQRRARLGSFEIIMTWRTAGQEGGRTEVVLFSKLNTQRFPNPPDVVNYLIKTLAPARSTHFCFLLKSVPSGEPMVGASIELEDSLGNHMPREGDPSSMLPSSDNQGRIKLEKLPFGSFTTTVRPPQRGNDGDEDQASGFALFDVHGQLPSKNLCVPMVPRPSDGQVRCVLTWGAFPEEISLFIKTPSGQIRSLAKDGDEGGGSVQVPNAVVECVQQEGGYGPISVLLEQLDPGRYHIFASCEPYNAAGREVGWPESNAQLTLYGTDVITWSGSTYFTVKKDAGVGTWWDVCFLQVGEDQSVVVREFNELVPEEPGNRSVRVTARDMEGRAVPKAMIKCQPEAAAYTSCGRYGDTNELGQFESLMALGVYTASVSAEGYLASSVRFTVDLDPVTPEVTVPMVKKEYFMEETNDLLLVLTWGGDGNAKLNVETPGRLLKNGEQADETYTTPPMTQMLMRGNNPKGVLLCPPDTALCMEGIVDRVFVQYQKTGIPMEKANMQLTVFSREGMEWSLSPEAPSTSQDCPFWEACTVDDGQIVAVSSRTAKDPARGANFAVRVIPARDDADYPPAAAVNFSPIAGDAVVRRFLEPPTQGSPDFTVDGEYCVFLDYGRYNIEAQDDKWHSPVTYDNLLWEPRTQGSLGLVMAEQRDLDAKTCYVTLSWAGQPDELDLCIRSNDGVVSSQAKADGRTSVIKGIRCECASTTGFGPKVISISQPISGKFRLFVVNKGIAGRVNLAGCHPIVNIVLYNGVWKSMRLTLPEPADPALDSKPNVSPCWHVCDIKIESDTKMGDQCLECTVVDKLLREEPAFDPT